VSESPSSPPEARGTDAPHHAAVYDSDEDLLGRVLPYLHVGLDRDEPVVAVVSEHAEAVLRYGLGADAERVHWQLPGADFQRLGQTFETLRRHLAGAAAAGSPARLLTENDVGGGSGRGAAHLRWDAMTNQTWAGMSSAWACLYDRRRHRTTVLEQIARAHPLLLDADGRSATSRRYIDPDEFVAAKPGPLSAVPPAVALDRWAHGFGDLTLGRQRVGAAAHLLGLPEQECRDVELAVGEVITNALQHGVSPCRVRMWRHRDTLVVRVDDRGPGDGVMTAGLCPPALDGRPGRGMWLVRLLADVVHVGLDPDGTGVELQFRCT